MKKVAIYGGAFDPPHSGHVYALWALLHDAEMDEIWVFPSGERVDKPHATSGGHRLAMLELLLNRHFSNEKKVILRNDQLDDDSCPSTSYLLLKHLENKEQNCAFHLVLGGELIPELTTWKHAENLCEETSFLIIPRLGMDVEDIPCRHYRLLNVPHDIEFHISSSLLKSFLKEEKSCAGILDPDVIAYIEAHGLYV